MNRANSAFTEQRQRFFFVLSGALVVALTLAAQSSQPGQKAANPAMPPSAVPQANDQTHLPIVRQQNSVNTERKRQLNEDSARLLKLANDLKVEVDKTNKDVLSMTVIRKADEIERLAHGVKEKMKLTVGDN
jgi:hypothetical protein